MSFTEREKEMCVLSLPSASSCLAPEIFSGADGILQSPHDGQATSVLNFPPAGNTALPIREHPLYSELQGM